ncbi:hypothetical protein UlMin_040399 [Ulmus minor]
MLISARQKEKRMVKKVELVLVAAFSLIVAASAAGDSKSDGRREWQLLTKLNYSSQIRLNPRILLLVTVPWCGESRSLMKEVANLVTERGEEFSSLKLMIMYRNTEKMLAEAIGAMADEITVLYYHHSVSYKYGGRLRAQSILFSIRPHFSALPEELPLKKLSTSEELMGFLGSTDRALILFEFCGWATKLLARGKKNVTENGHLLGTGFRGETNSRPAPMGKNIQKGTDNARMMCGVDNEFDGVPWFVSLSSVNDSVPFEETENIMPGALSCTFEDYNKFDTFFSKFTSVAKDFLLPPERHRSGLVLDRSLLSTIGIGESGSWLAVLYFSGCPKCLKIINKEDDLNDILQMDNSVITEVEGNGHTLEPVLPANRPSILLFVDRSSNSSEIRRKSMEALDSFRELALHSHNLYQNVHKPEKSFNEYQTFRSTSEHPRLKLSPTAKVMRLKEKMSTIIIVDEGKHVTLDKIVSDFQGNSLRNILEYFLKQKKEATLSSLAKELGFQLISDDIDIKLVNTLPSGTKVQSDQVAPKEAKEDPVSKADDLEKDQLPPKTSLTAEDLPVTSEVTDAQRTSKHDEVETENVDTNKQLFVESEPVPHQEHESAQKVEVEETSLQLDKSDHQQLHFQGFEGSFFFSDGNYRLLQALTGGTKIPGLVIVDPLVAEHYVLPEENDVNYFSLVDFLTGFLNNSLIPYIQSESVPQSPREAMQPPFVNVDFHEVDSIPRITSKTFSELVLGFNQSETDAWHKDVLVLFSNRWCGFCQRMDLVVRELYRAIKGYVTTIQSGSRNGKTMFHGDNQKDVMLKLPLIYLLDCTLNDCSLILRSLNQREVYPSLILFPAEKKNPIPYEGDMRVADVVKFVADRGSNSHHLIHENGILWSVAKKGESNQNSFGTASSTMDHEETRTSKDRFHEVLLTNPTQNQLKSQALKDSSGKSPRVVVGSILVATDKLQNADPFGNSKILIIKADQSTGFLGLIINKHIRWDALQGLEEGLQILVEAPLSFGGPLALRGRPLVALTRKVMNDQYPEVLPGIYFLDQIATSHAIEELKSGNQPIADYWFFLGYSSWDWDQLFDEIAERAWYTSDSDDSMTHFGWPSS